MVEKAFLKNFVELQTAETEKEKAEGVKNQELGEHQGMLFNYSQAKQRKFWMKDTPTPLDIIFLDSNGEVINIEKGEPFSEEPVTSNEPCKHVLELRQGKAKDFSISEDDNLSFLL